MLDVSKAFEFCDALDISKMHEVRYADVYFVEIQKIEKTILLHIKKLLSDKTDSLIYFFIDDSQNLMLFQLAALLNVKNIITPKHETSKIISQIKQDILFKKTTAQNKEIVSVFSDNISFMIIKENKLSYASEKLLHDFKSKDLNALELNLCSKIDLKLLLEKETTKEVNIAFDETSKTYNIKSIGSKLGLDKYIFVEDTSQKKPIKNKNLDFIKSRFSFMEVLKETLLEKKPTTYFIITISIENIDSLRKFWNDYEIETEISNLLLQVKSEINSDTILAQYDNKLYLTLFKELDFEVTKQKAQTFQKHILTYTAKEEIKPIVTLHVLDINDFNLNNTLKIISDIAKEKISNKDIETKKIHRVVGIDSELNDEETIDMFLQTTFTNNTPIKLLNIYKGLCINNSSTIVKKTKEEIYISFEQLQGTVMNFEKKTVIQSASLTKDIEADVKLIDLKKGIALLKNFRFIDGSAISRKNSRVTSSQRTPISIVSQKGSLSGEILDISMHSIAIKTRVFKQVEELNSTDVELKFTLPIKSSEDGYMKLELDAKVSLIKCTEDHCKIVVDLKEDQIHESILMEYIYDRQKELIAELKKQTIMRN